MKILLAYRFTGEDPVELKETLGRMTAVLRRLGHTVYCSIEDEDSFKGGKQTNKQIMEHAFREVDKVDMVFAFIRSNEKSEGMLMEVGYAFGQKKRVGLALKRGCFTTSLHEMADPFVEFDTVDELCDKLHITDFEKE